MNSHDNINNEHGLLFTFQLQEGETAMEKCLKKD